MLVTATATPSSHAFQTCSSNSPPDRRASLAGRAIGDVRDPELIHPGECQAAGQVEGDLQLMIGIRAVPPSLCQVCSFRLSQSRDSVQHRSVTDVLLVLVMP